MTAAERISAHTIWRVARSLVRRYILSMSDQSLPTLADAMAAYGRAMEHVQALEQLMRIALSEREVKGALLAQREVSPAFGSKLLNFDFGKLEQRVCSKFKFDKFQTTVMSDMRDIRNSLAHNFWVHHQGHLKTCRGVRIVIRDAALAVRQINRVAAMIIDQTGVDAKRYANFIASRADHDPSLTAWEEALSRAELVFEGTVLAARPRLSEGDRSA